MASRLCRLCSAWLDVDAGTPRMHLLGSDLSTNSIEENFVAPQCVDTGHVPLHCLEANGLDRNVSGIANRLVVFLGERPFRTDDGIEALLVGDFVAQLEQRGI